MTAIGESAVIVMVRIIEIGMNHTTSPDCGGGGQSIEYCKLSINFKNRVIQQPLVWVRDLLTSAISRILVSRHKFAGGEIIVCKINPS